MPIRSLLMWGVIALVLVGLFTMFQGGGDAARERAATEMSYSQLMDRVAAGDITAVTTKPDMLLSRSRDGKDYATYLPPDTMANVIERLDAANVEIETKQPQRGPSIGDVIVGLLPILLLIGAWFFFMRQMQGGGRGGAMGFGRSKAKLLTEAKGRITFEDVAGIDEAKEELGEIVEFLKDAGKFQRLGGKIPKGALLIGPPGTGKTLLARAIAGEANVPFFTISGSDFVEMFVGVGASRVRDMFEQAKKNAPCIIFIDEKRIDQPSAKMEALLDNLAELILSFVDAGDILKGDAALGFGEQLGFRAAKAHGPAAPAALHLTHEKEPSADQQQDRQQTDKNFADAGAGARPLGFDLHVSGIEPLDNVSHGAVGQIRDIALAVAGVAQQPVALGGDGGDVAGVNVIQQLRIEQGIPVACAVAPASKLGKRHDNTQGHKAPNQQRTDRHEPTFWPRIRRVWECSSKIGTTPAAEHP